MVYVDNYRAEFKGMVMCHMAADSTAELLAMADRIGVRRQWLQDASTWKEHFDVCISTRKKAVEAGAIEVSIFDLVRWMMKKRQIRPTPDP